MSLVLSLSYVSFHPLLSLLPLFPFYCSSHISLPTTLSFPFYYIALFFPFSFTPFSFSVFFQFPSLSHFPFHHPLPFLSHHSLLPTPPTSHSTHSFLFPPLPPFHPVTFSLAFYPPLICLSITLSFSFLSHHSLLSLSITHTFPFPLLSPFLYHHSFVCLPIMFSFSSHHPLFSPSISISFPYPISLSFPFLSPCPFPCHSHALFLTTLPFSFLSASSFPSHHLLFSFSSPCSNYIIISLFFSPTPPPPISLFIHSYILFL